MQAPLAPYLLLMQATGDAAPSGAAQTAAAEDFGQRLVHWLQSPTAMLVIGTLVGAVGLWLLLPRGTRRGRTFGALLALFALAQFSALTPKLVFGWTETGFAAIAVVTIVSCAATISSRNPLYAAIWFGMALLGTAGLFLLQGAQFLALATVVVYAGAILVTFLFALMLAQPGGHAFYDRISWEASLSAATGAILVGLMSATLAGAFSPPAAGGEGEPAVAAAGIPTTDAAALHEGVLADQHVARLGGWLFTRHLIAVEVAGALLLAALVGAMAIVHQSGRGSAPLRGFRSQTTPLANDHGVHGIHGDRGAAASNGAAAASGGKSGQATAGSSAAGGCSDV